LQEDPVKYNLVNGRKEEAIKSINKIYKLETDTADEIIDQKMKTMQK
jgi:hypothetical protein